MVGRNENSPTESGKTWKVTLVCHCLSVRDKRTGLACHRGNVSLTIIWNVINVSSTSQ